MKKIFYIVGLFLSTIAYSQTTTNLGLQLPPQGYPNWNVPMNTNFTIVDSRLGGIYQGTWSSTVTYFIPQMVNYLGVTYISLTNTNLNNIPSSSPSNWAVIGASGSGSGTVTSFSSGSLSPLFTTSVTNSTTTPVQSFTLSAASANSVFGNFTGSSASPAFSTNPIFSAANLTNFPTFNQNTTGTSGGLSGSPAITVSNVTDSGLTSGNCVQASTGGLLTTTGSACGSGSGNGFPIIIGSTSIASGSTTTAISGLTLTSPTLTTPALGTPASGTLTNATGLPVSTGISGLATGMATFLGTPSSANLAATVTNETGSGLLVFATSPTLTTPNIGSATASGLTLSGITGSTQCLQVNTSGAISGTGATCGSGGGSGISGLTANFIPLAGSATTITANSHLDDGVTTAATITSSEPIAVNATSSPSAVLMAPDAIAPAVTAGYAGWGINTTLTTGGFYLMPDSPGSGLWTASNSAGIVTNTFTALPLSVSNGGSGTATPGLVAGTNITVTGTWPNQTITASATAATAFSALTGSTNTTAAMIVGTGASLAVTGSGTIAATSAPLAGISGLATGIATFLGTPSSANLAAALTNETGTGLIVFATSPTLVTPLLGTPTSGVITNLTGTCTSCTANAAVSAAKWTTARNLAGNSVDGSADVPFSNKFIVQGTTDTGLSNAQFLGALSTGILKVTTTTGVLSDAVAGTDYLTPTGSATGLSKASASVFGVSECDGTTITCSGGIFTAVSGGSGTVTTFSAGNLSPLFTTSVATATTTPALTFALSNAAQNSVLAGPATGGAGAPSYQTAPTISAANMTSFPTFNQNTTGTAANLSGTPALPNGTTATTQTVGDSTTKIATDAFVLANAGSISGLTTGFFTKAGSATTVVNTLCDEGITTASTITCTDTGGIVAPSFSTNGSSSGSIALSGSSSGTVTITVPATAGTPTITLGSSSGTPAVTASSPLAITTSTGNITCSTCGVTGSGLNQFASTTSAQLAGVISDETGSGVLVFAVSPALTGSPTSPTQTAGDSTTDIATDAFVATAVNNAIAGVNPAVAVFAASTANLTGTYSNGVSGVGATFTITATGAFTLDGVAINTTGQRVLLKNQTSGFQNGVYTATVVGTTGISPIFTRALDYNTPSDINSTGAIPVQSGTANTTTSWLLTSTVNTVGTDSLTYVQFSLNPTTILISGGALGTPSSGTLTNATGLPISTGVSGLATGIATFLGTPSSANLATALTDETGSGAAVFATSPTMVTPVLGAATATSLLATGNVDGTAPITVTTGTTATLGGTFRSGYTYNQEATAATAVTYTLPTAAAGRQYCIGNSWNGSAATTGVLTLATSASGQFIIFTDGTLSATGGNITSGGAAVDAACVVGVDATHWQLYTQRGTWTKH